MDQCRPTDPAELDVEAASWIIESYEFGMQRWDPAQIPAYHS